MARALLVPHQDVLDLALLENLVIDRKHRAARIAEEMLHAVIDQRANDHRGSRHLVRIVALVAHWLAPDALFRGADFVGLVWEIKKGPQEAPCAPPELEWPQPPGAMHLGTTTIRSLAIILRICLLRLPKGCANIASPTRMSRQSRFPRDFRQISPVPGIRRERICCSRAKTASWQGCAGFQPSPRRLRGHPFELRQLVPEPGELPFGV